MAKKKASTLKIPTASSLMKKYKGSGFASAVVKEVELWIPSRFLALNHQLGGGIPYGKIVEIFGEESSGKSLLALDFAYCTQQLNGIVIWVDAEKAFTKKWAEQNGLDIDKIWLYSDNTVENISDFILESVLYWRSQLTNNEPILLVVDSIASFECIENQNSMQLERKAEMGNRAKAIDMMLRNRNPLLDEYGVGSIWINQLRAKLGASKFEDPDTTPGGKAMAYYASIRIGVYGGKQIKEKIKGVERRTGRVSSIRIKKNKVAPPRPTIKSAPVYFDSKSKNEIGFSRYFGFPEILEELEVLIRKKGASRYYLKEKMIANGEDALIKKIKEDDDLRRKLIRKSRINTISMTQDKLDNIKKNLFPITEEKTKKSKKDDEE